MTRRIDDVTVVIKTFLRPDHCTKLVRSIRKRYPDIKIVVVNDGNDKKFWGDDNMKTIILPFNSGLSAGRNAGVAAVETKYFVLADDDFIFTDQTNVERWRDLLIEYDFDILGSKVGGVWDTPKWYFWKWHYDTEKNLIRRQPGEYYECWGDEGKKVYHADFCLNSFIAKTDAVRNHPWDEKYKLLEHLPYFWKYRNDLKVGFAEEIFVDHSDANSPKAYKQFRRHRSVLPVYRSMHRDDGFYFDYNTSSTGFRGRRYKPRNNRGRQLVRRVQAEKRGWA